MWLEHVYESQSTITYNIQLKEKVKFLARQEFFLVFIAFGKKGWSPLNWMNNFHIILYAGAQKINETV